MTSRRTDAGVSTENPAANVSSTHADRTRSAASAAGTGMPTQEPAPAGRVFVLDTSVLLSDPAAFRRFTDHEVVVPARGDLRVGGQAPPP